MTKKAKKQILNIVFLVVLIGITLVILVLSNSELNFANIFSFLHSANVWLLLVAVVCMLLYILFEGVSLHVVSRKIGHRAKFRSSVAYAAADVYYSGITPSATGGQPASAFYMVKDGMDAGKASFALVFNLMAYTAAIVIIGAAAFALQPFLLWDCGGFTVFLVMLGVALQLLLLGFFIACICWHKAVLKIGGGIVKLLAKMRIVKNREKWLDKIATEVDKYRSSFHEMRRRPGLIAATLILNVLQRVSQILIPSFVCLAVDPSADFVRLFAMQAFVTLGYNSIPLPGGVGAYEYLYLRIYALSFEQAFILSAMMVTRAISYYLSLIVSGVYTLTYHIIRMKKTPKDGGEPADTGGENAEPSKEEKDEDESVPCEEAETMTETAKEEEGEESRDIREPEYDSEKSETGIH